jgi:hypothetical protein
MILDTSGRIVNCDHNSTNSHPGFAAWWHSLIVGLASLNWNKRKAYHAIKMAIIRCREVQYFNGRYINATRSSVVCGLALVLADMDVGLRRVCILCECVCIVSSWPCTWMVYNSSELLMLLLYHTIRVKHLQSRSLQCVGLTIWTLAR